ncbi:hypothetical protein B0H11DRAFT_1912992 [Mycena galericulata]|nr:hypothetical protein B0H11DRAFT_1912992 [Mycena galericulata]
MYQWLQGLKNPSPSRTGTPADETSSRTTVSRLLVGKVRRILTRNDDTYSTSTTDFLPVTLFEIDSEDREDLLDMLDSVDSESEDCPRSPDSRVDERRREHGLNPREKKKGGISPRVFLQECRILAFPRFYERTLVGKLDVHTAGVHSIFWRLQVLPIPLSVLRSRSVSGSDCDGARTALTSRVRQRFALAPGGTAPPGWTRTIAGVLPDEGIEEEPARDFVRHQPRDFLRSRCRRQARHHLLCGVRGRLQLLDDGYENGLLVEPAHDFVEQPPLSRSGSISFDPVPGCKRDIAPFTACARLCMAPTLSRWGPISADPAPGSGAISLLRGAGGSAAASRHEGYDERLEIVVSLLTPVSQPAHDIGVLDAARSHPIPLPDASATFYIPQDFPYPLRHRPAQRCTGSNCKLRITRYDDARRTGLLPTAQTLARDVQHQHAHAISGDLAVSTLLGAVYRPRSTPPSPVQCTAADAGDLGWVEEIADKLAGRILLFPRRLGDACLAVTSTPIGMARRFGEKLEGGCPASRSRGALRRTRDADPLAEDLRLVAEPRRDVPHSSEVFSNTQHAEMLHVLVVSAACAGCPAPRATRTTGGHPRATDTRLVPGIHRDATRSSEGLGTQRAERRAKDAQRRREIEKRPSMPTPTCMSACASTAERMDVEIRVRECGGGMNGTWRRSRARCGRGCGKSLSDLGMGISTPVRGETPVPPLSALASSTPAPYATHRRHAHDERQMLRMHGAVVHRTTNTREWGRRNVTEWRTSCGGAAIVTQRLRERHDICLGGGKWRVASVEDAGGGRGGRRGYMGGAGSGGRRLLDDTVEERVVRAYGSWGGYAARNFGVAPRTRRPREARRLRFIPPHLARLSQPVILPPPSVDRLPDLPVPTVPGRVDNTLEPPAARGAFVVAEVASGGWRAICTVSVESRVFAHRGPGRSEDSFSTNNLHLPFVTEISPSLNSLAPPFAIRTIHISVILCWRRPYSHSRPLALVPQFWPFA